MLTVLQNFEIWDSTVFKLFKIDKLQSQKSQVQISDLEFSLETNFPTTHPSTHPTTHPSIHPSIHPPPR